jgi:hypothetical protein
MTQPSKDPTSALVAATVLSQEQADALERAAKRFRFRGVGGLLEKLVEAVLANKIEKVVDAETGEQVLLVELRRSLGKKRRG